MSSVNMLIYIWEPSIVDRGVDRELVAAPFSSFLFFVFHIFDFVPNNFRQIITKLCYVKIRLMYSEILNLETWPDHKEQTISN